MECTACGHREELGHGAMAYAAHGKSFQLWRLRWMGRWRAGRQTFCAGYVQGHQAMPRDLYVGTEREGVVGARCTRRGRRAAAARASAAHTTAETVAEALTRMVKVCVEVLPRSFAHLEAACVQLGHSLGFAASPSTTSGTSAARRYLGSSPTRAHCLLKIL